MVYLSFFILDTHFQVSEQKYSEVKPHTVLILQDG